MYVDMSGAAAGSGGAGVPGYGARVQSYLSVTPGSLLHVTVGCQGANCPTSNLVTPTYISGGYNGGAAGYGKVENVGGTGGGGSSDVRLGGLSLSDRIIVAGGGGGYYCGNDCNPKKGGNAGKYGSSGSLVTSGCPTTAVGHYAGGGGNWSAGGIAGFSVALPSPTGGTLGFGGNGGYGNSGGGGGGYFGGTVVFHIFLFLFIHMLY
jgi:hypothetical protein